MWELIHKPIVRRLLGVYEFLKSKLWLLVALTNISLD